MGNDGADSRGDDVDQTATELEPMYNPHHGNSTDVDGQSGAATKQPTDGVKDDGAAEEGGKWTTIRDVLERFAGDTSLLGVPRAILASSGLSRLFWVVVCVTCMGFFIQGCTEQLMRYFSYPKQVRVRSNISQFSPRGIIPVRNVDTAGGPTRKTER